MDLDAFLPSCWTRCDLSNFLSSAQPLARHRATAFVLGNQREHSPGCDDGSLSRSNCAKRPRTTFHPFDEHSPSDLLLPLDEDDCQLVTSLDTMPIRLRNTAAAEAAQKEHRYDIPGLEFEDSLRWRAGKAIPVADLLTRLQKLAAELRNYDIDQVDSRAFTTLAHDLANANLLGHKDKGVRAWTVSCIVDVLKICAPDAPFLEGQLKVSGSSTGYMEALD